MAIPTSIKTLLSGDVVEWARIELKETWDPAASLKSFKGPIQQQLRDALQYIRNVVITEKVIKYPDRAEADRFFNFPYAAIEEALANAVCHRAYDEREPIEVQVENDRIEIVSFPGPDRSVTIEGLKSFRVSNRRYRNRRIGDLLKELRLTEGRNTGFKKILDALEANGSPKPEFETDEDRSYFITRLFVHEGFAADVDKELKRSQKGAEKRSRKKTGNNRKSDEESVLHSNSIDGENEFNEKTGTKRYEGITGRRYIGKRGYK